MPTQEGPNGKRRPIARPSGESCVGSRATHCRRGYGQMAWNSTIFRPTLFSPSTLAELFFPSNIPSASLLASLATFGVGFVTRPIGAWVIGRMGDRLGRKPAMSLSFSLTGIAITGLALTPSHSRIGVAAPVLVIFFRLLQGFALCREVGPSTAFLLEAAPPERRGFYTSFQSWSQHLSILVSGLVGFGLANILSPQQLQDYGPRIAFLFGVSIVPLGIVMRRSMPETSFMPQRSVNPRTEAFARTCG